MPQDSVVHGDKNDGLKARARPASTKLAGFYGPNPAFSPAVEPPPYIHTKTGAPLLALAVLVEFAIIASGTSTSKRRRFSDIVRSWAGAGKSWGREVTAQREVDYPPSSSPNSFTKSTFKKVT